MSIFFCFIENCYHVIENVPVKDRRSDTFQVNNLVSNGDSVLFNSLWRSPIWAKLASELFSITHPDNET